MDGEIDVQDIGRELHDMMKDIDSITLHSSKALEYLDAMSVRRSHASCIEGSIECIKVFSFQSHSTLDALSLHNLIIHTNFFLRAINFFLARTHLPPFPDVLFSCMQALGIAAFFRLNSKETLLRLKHNLKLSQIN